MNGRIKEEDHTFKRIPIPNCMIDFLLEIILFEICH